MHYHYVTNAAGTAIALPSWYSQGEPHTVIYASSNSSLMYAFDNSVVVLGPLARCSPLIFCNVFVCMQRTALGST